MSTGVTEEEELADCSVEGCDNLTRLRFEGSGAPVCWKCIGRFRARANRRRGKQF